MSASNTAVSDRLRELGIELPAVAAPVAAYVPAVRVGDLVYTSGQLPFVDGELLAAGKVGEDARGGAARPARIARSTAGRGRRPVGTTVMVIKVTGCRLPPIQRPAGVINGASDLWRDFRDAGACPFRRRNELPLVPRSRSSHRPGRGLDPPDVRVGGRARARMGAWSIPRTANCVPSLSRWRRPSPNPSYLAGGYERLRHPAEGDSAASSSTPGRRTRATRPPPNAGESRCPADHRHPTPMARTASPPVPLPGALDHLLQRRAPLTDGERPADGVTPQVEVADPGHTARCFFVPATADDVEGIMTGDTIVGRHTTMISETDVIWACTKTLHLLQDRGDGACCPATARISRTSRLTQYIERCEQRPGQEAIRSARTPPRPISTRSTPTSTRCCATRRSSRPA